MDITSQVKVSILMVQSPDNRVFGHLGILESWLNCLWINSEASRNSPTQKEMKAESLVALMMSNARSTSKTLMRDCIPNPKFRRVKCSIHPSTDGSPVGAVAGRGSHCRRPFTYDTSTRLNSIRAKRVLPLAGRGSRLPAGNYYVIVLRSIYSMKLNATFDIRSVRA